MFKCLGANGFDALRLAGASEAELSDLIGEVHGLPILEEAYGRGKGLIVITGHIGCWELLPACFIQHGYITTVVARQLPNRFLNDYVVSARASVGVRTVDRNANPREMLKVLHNGEVLGVLIDQHTSVAGTYVPFFNRPAYTPTGVAKLSVLTGAPILPMAIFATREGKHDVRVSPPIDIPENRGDRDEQIRELTAACSLAVENLIRIDPKQWVWFHNRWRGEPARDLEYAVQT